MAARLYLNESAQTTSWTGRLLPESVLEVKELRTWAIIPPTSHVRRGSWESTSSRNVWTRHQSIDPDRLLHNTTSREEQEEVEAYLSLQHTSSDILKPINLAYIISQDLQLGSAQLLSLESWAAFETVVKTSKQRLLELLPNVALCKYAIVLIISPNFKARHVDRHLVERSC